MTRLLFLVHRYLGLAVGALMVMWCLSGVVMMYVSYPDLAEDTRLGHLTPIDWHGCCKISDRLLADDSPVNDAQIEMLAGRPVLRLHTATESRLIDLSTGNPMDRISTTEATAVAQTYTERSRSVAPHLLDQVDYDPWTISGSFNADRPLYHFELNEGTELYVSSSSGRAVQLTTAGGRFWNWLGAIPHWLYFSELRHKPALWRNVLISTSLMGCFLAATGLYIGVTQFIRRSGGRWSPYQGFNLWHHLAGLIFGLFAMTWVLSGFLSMNPWGWMEGEGARMELSQLHGKRNSFGADLKGGLAAFARFHPPGVVSVEIAPLAGQLYFLSSTAAGERRRFNANVLPAALNSLDLTFIADVLGGADSPADSLMTQEDSYYFSHHRDVARLPVYRVTLGDGTRYYIDALSGGLIAKMDRDVREYRWLHQALHRMDFSAVLRGRPQWDVLMLILMLGVTTLCVTGTYLGFRRISRQRYAVRP
jgi:PepSY-associated TM region